MMNQQREWMYRMGVLALTAVWLAAGCSRSAAPQAEPTVEAGAAVAEEPPMDPIGRIFMQAEEHLAGGRTNDAVAAIEAGLKDPALADSRQHLFSGLIRLLLFSGQTDAAKKRMLDAYQNDGQLAVGALGLIYSHFMEQGNNEAVVDWTEQVLAVSSLPGEVRRSMREWNLQAHLALKHDARVLEIVAQLIKEAPAGDALNILARAIDTLFEQKRIEQVQQVFQQISRVVTSETGTQTLVLNTRLRLLAAKDDWDGILSAFPAAAGKLPDADLQRLLGQILAQAKRGGRTDVSDTLCEAMIEKAGDKPQTLQVAGRQWVENAMPKDPLALAARLERLQRAKLPVRQVCNLFMRHFYSVIDQPAAVAAMKSLGARLVPLAEDDETRNSIRTMVLDASFVLEDYDTALEILQARIAGRDDAWHAMAISKVKAHQALKKQQPREAVKYFREFMATIVAGKDQETSDPATGLVHSKEMILGRNARRIGDILAKIPDAESARKAYDEARGYYKQALAGKHDAAVADIIKKEMDAIP